MLGRTTSQQLLAFKGKPLILSLIKSKIREIKIRSLTFDGIRN